MDSVVMNNAGALSLDGAMLSGFERLTKQNLGLATLTGTQLHEWRSAQRRHCRWPVR
jgi:hypothetical protein